MSEVRARDQQTNMFAEKPVMKVKKWAIIKPSTAMDNLSLQRSLSMKVNEISKRTPNLFA